MLEVTYSAARINPASTNNFLSILRFGLNLPLVPHSSKNISLRDRLCVSPANSIHLEQFKYYL